MLRDRRRRGASKKAVARKRIGRMLVSSESTDLRRRIAGTSTEELPTVIQLETHDLISFDSEASDEDATAFEAHFADTELDA